MPLFFQSRLFQLCTVGGVVLAGVGYFFMRDAQPAEPVKSEQSGGVFLRDTDELILTKEQTSELKVGTVDSKLFAQRAEAIGLIDYNQDLAVQVFSPYQGRIAQVLVKAGDDVAQGQILYTVQMPDLAQAASVLISTAGTLKVTTDVLRRATNLYETQSISLKELQQNTADQQAADATYRAARKSLALFGLSNADMDDVEVKRKVDTEMPVRSPFAGRVTVRAGSPGQLVQPGTGIAPVMVANLQTLWMIASVPESEIGAYKIGQAATVRVQAYPDTAFTGKISYISDVADSTTHRVTIRAEVNNKQHQLKPQMLASFSILLGSPVASLDVPINALVRESDGASSVWVAKGDLQFKRRKVTAGMVQDGMVQIVSGLAEGEKIAKDKALFLSNLLAITLN